MSYQYHQLLKYLYFEGYANSYEEAEYLLEELNDYEFYELYENVSGGRARRASSRRAPISQRPTNSDVISANNMGSLSRSNPAKPQDKGDARNSGYIGGEKGVRARLEQERSHANQERQRRRDAWNATRHGRGSDDLWKGEKYYRDHRMVPSRGIGNLEQSLRRGRTDDRGITRPTTPQSLAKSRLKDLNWLVRNGYGDEGTKKKVKRMRAAIRNKDKWGTPEAAKEEYVIDYLVTEGYTDNYDSAIFIYESMSEEWLDTILEVRGGGEVTRDNYRERGMRHPPHIKTYMKKMKVENEIEGREANIRAATGAEHPGYSPDPEPDEDFGGRRPSRREVQSQRRKNRFANEVIRNSPRLKKLKTRFKRLHDVDQRW